MYSSFFLILANLKAIEAIITNSILDFVTWKDVINVMIIAQRGTEGYIRSRM